VKTIEEALKLDTHGMLEEIQERRTVIKDMIGWLYQGILEAEISKLYDEIERRSNHARKA
jgi:hypothetical protein